MGYLPIEDYGVIGDCHTVALVGRNGSIDWCCFPEFDSPSVFAAILDDARGGCFQIRPARDDYSTRQMYLPDTNVLLTRFFSPEGMAEIADFMPIEADTHATWNHRIVRRLQVIHGEVRFRLVCRPAFNYARTEHTIEAQDHGVVFHTPALSLGLAAGVPLQVEGPAVTAQFTLRAGECAVFVLHRVAEGAGPEPALEDKDVRPIFEDTVAFWQNWLQHCTYRGRWREHVYRSALMLKMLISATHGSVVAAPTTSLPEVIGGVRNWDYRYCWIRDASFTIYALLNLGFHEEAGRFMNWVEARCRELDPHHGGLQIMYGLDGRHTLPEETLDHLSGYRDSRPVRIGNAAYKQRQLDIYGELMDSVYLYNKYARPLSYDQWTYLRALLDWLTKHWQEPDSGLWEVRSVDRPFVYSRFMTWVAFDRGIRIARQRGLPAGDADWKAARNAVYEEVMAKGWSDKVGSFVQYYGATTLDASNLLMPIVKFVGPTDPRMRATISRTLEQLTFDSLVYRYQLSNGADDGLPGQDGTFSLCSFWLVEALTRAGRLKEARLKLEKMFGYGNHLGLYAEEIGTTGQMLGNFPQAFTHLALINAAINLDRALDNPHQPEAL